MRAGSWMFTHRPLCLMMRTLPPTLVDRDEPLRPEGPRGRTKLWEFNGDLHCSIIGTCLSTVELRQALRRLCLPHRTPPITNCIALRSAFAGVTRSPRKSLTKDTASRSIDSVKPQLGSRVDHVA